MDDKFALSVLFILTLIMTAFIVSFIAIPYYFDKLDSRNH